MSDGRTQPSAVPTSTSAVAPPSQPELGTVYDLSAANGHSLRFKYSHTNGVALIGPPLLELTYPLALEPVLHSAIVTDFTMERLPDSLSLSRKSHLF